MPTTFTSLRTAQNLTVGAALIAVGAITGASFTAPAGSDTAVNAPSGQSVVLQLAGTPFKAYSPPDTCTATGGVATYDVCLLDSPLTTTGALRGLALECGNVAKPLQIDASFVKAANSATGTTLPNFNDRTAGTGAWVYNYTGSLLWNPADKIKVGSLTSPTGTLSTSRYDCQIRAEVDDIYGR